MKNKRLEQDAVSTLTTSTEDMSISSEGADDCVSNMPSARYQSANAAVKRTGNKQQPATNGNNRRLLSPQAPSFGFRRCSLEHARRRHTPRNTDDMSTASYPANRPRRRSSLKSGPSPFVKNVTFSNNVHMKKIPHRNERYRQAAWLSREERSLITEQAKTDMRIVKHLAKNPDLAARPDMIRLRNLISVRGMEHLFSKKTMRIPKNEREEVVCAVLEAQQRMGNSHSSSFSSLDSTYHASIGGDADMADSIARICTDRSLPSRERARRLAIGDEAAIRSYVGQTAKGRMSTSSASSSSAQRKSSPGGSNTTKHYHEMKQSAADSHFAHHNADTSSRTLGSLDSFGVDNEDGMPQRRRASDPGGNSNKSSCFKLNINDESCEPDTAFFVYP